MSALYNSQGADELVSYYVTASTDRSDTMVEVVEQVSEQAYIPLSFGGGIRSVEDMRRMPNAWEEKGGLWNVWPKKTSGVASEFSQPVVCRIGLAAGQVECEISGIDTTRSGLPFTRHMFT